MSPMWPALLRRSRWGRLRRVPQPLQRPAFIHALPRLSAGPAGHDRAGAYPADPASRRRRQRAAGRDNHHPHAPGAGTNHAPSRLNPAR